jgi:hypothetical protein
MEVMTFLVEVSTGISQSMQWRKDRGIALIYRVSTEKLAVMNHLIIQLLLVLCAKRGKSGLISIVTLSYFLKGPTKHARKSATPYIARLKMSVDFATLHVLNTFLRAALISVIFAREPSWMLT